MNRTQLIIAGSLAVATNLYSMAGKTPESAGAFARSIEERDELIQPRLLLKIASHTGRPGDQVAYSHGPFLIPCTRNRISTCFKA